MTAAFEAWKADSHRQTGRCIMWKWSSWAPVDIEDQLIDWPLIYVGVNTPKDQAVLHRALARLGYCPVLLASDEVCDYWRFHHPDGPRPI